MRFSNETASHQLPRSSSAAQLDDRGPLAIVLDHVSKDYVSAGRVVRALQECTLSIARGELFGLFGPNGAGKSTLINLLSTLISPSHGRAAVWGHDVSREAVQVRRHIGVLAETQRAFHGRLSGRQNLLFFAGLHGLSASQGSLRIVQLLSEFGLEDAADRPVQTYSSGMLQRLHIARVLVHDPPVLLLDEPTNRMDLQTADLVRHLVKDELVGKRHKTVLYTTHDLYEMDHFCDRIAILNQGRLVACGTVPALVADLHLEECLRVEITPGAGATIQALRNVPGVTALRVVRRDNTRTELEIVVKDATPASLVKLCAALSTHQEVVHRLDHQGGNGIGRLLRYYASAGEGG